MKAAEKVIATVESASTVLRLKEQLVSNGFVDIKGAIGALKSILLVSLFKEFSRQVVYFSAENEETEGIRDDAVTLLGDENVCYFPKSSLYELGIGFANDSAKTASLHTLESLSDQKPQIVVADGSGLLKKLPKPKHFQGSRISISIQDQLDFDQALQKLYDLGFTREDRVEQHGEMCVRGGIIDLFPFSHQHPVRIEFWGDTVESLRKFDPASQRSIEEVNKIDIFPQDFGFLDESDDSSLQANLLDYIRKDAIVVLDEPAIIRKKIAPLSIDDFNDEIDFEKPVENSPDESVWTELRQHVDKFQQIRFISIAEAKSDLIDLNSSSQVPFKGSLKQFKSHLKTLETEKLNGHIEPPLFFYCCENQGQTERLREIFNEEEIESPRLQVASLPLHKGFVFPEGNLVIFTDHQFYGRSKRLRLPKKSFKGLTATQLKKLNIGDYVVHVDFGIGKFLGLKKVRVQKNERECLHLEYKERDKVYVRIERMDRVNKYSPKDGVKPVLSKLGSPEWQRMKNRTKKRLKDMAKELIDIYAKRKDKNGRAFLPDSLWQRELEASFPYEDTPDQITASHDVKADMENPKPMDRLVCGDVGFGKTEIAVRAAFKAVLSGSQVAMLVPTTILACQHYNTFKERLQRFPVEVEMLSRFRTKAEQKQIIERVKNGQVDIIIGTHRLLSKDVELKNPGLIIIDEEQRFGVRHKERLKRFRATIDVLTLTATPIPRTLQFSLMGARDMSYINTAPKNRLPIITEVLPFNKNYIREVILRELDRQGQVFFVHNRVRSIERVAMMLATLIPEGKIAVAHGQMHENELEKIMLDFETHKYNILVSTMIIESGLDMPNVNTIIVNRADKFGLAQLYQLRGRVGRSHQRAYAYLLIPPVETLTDEAMKRLRALEEFSDLGSGTRLAMRDLEIRGAGNLLGAEQSGFIDALGFELYNKILDEAVKELQSQTDSDEATEAPPEIDPKVEVDCDTYLPENYVNSSSERVDIYQRLTDSDSVEEVDDIVSEIEDRFGRLPEPAENLLNFVAIRILAKQLALKSVKIGQQQLAIEFSPELLNMEREQLKKWLGSIVNKANQEFAFFQNEGIGMRVDIDAEKGNDLLMPRKFLESLCAAKTDVIYDN